MTNNFANFGEKNPFEVIFIFSIENIEMIYIKYVPI